MSVKEIKAIEPAREYTTKEYCCDICKNKIPSRYDFDDDGTSYETKVATKDFGVYGEEDGSTILSFDICHDCFISKIIPLISKEYNIKPREEYV